VIYQIYNELVFLSVRILILRSKLAAYTPTLMRLDVVKLRQTLLSSLRVQNANK